MYRQSILDTQLCTRGQMTQRHIHFLFELESMADDDYTHIHSRRLSQENRVSLPEYR